MALSPEQEQLEHRLKVTQMLTSIEQMEASVAKFKSDIAMDEKKHKLEQRKFLVSLVVGAAACVGAGVALATYVDHHQPQVTQSQGKP
jgi:uncharacterized protein YlxW (UPF0749 family)